MPSLHECGTRSISEGVGLAIKFSVPLTAIRRQSGMKPDFSTACLGTKVGHIDPLRLGCGGGPRNRRERSRCPLRTGVSCPILMPSHPGRNHPLLDRACLDGDRLDLRVLVRDAYAGSALGPGGEGRPALLDGGAVGRRGFAVPEIRAIGGFGKRGSRIGRAASASRGRRRR
jgi:hypothetical protein